MIVRPSVSKPATETTFSGNSLCHVRSVPCALAFDVEFRPDAVHLRLAMPGVPSAPDDVLIFDDPAIIAHWALIEARVHQLALDQAEGDSGWLAALRSMGLG